MMTVMTVLMMRDTESITLIDTTGREQKVTSSTVLTVLGVGWTAFVLSLGFNILYYVLHPSQV